MQRGTGHRLTSQPAVLLALIAFVVSVIRLRLQQKQKHQHRQQSQLQQPRQYSLLTHSDHQPEGISMRSATLSAPCCHAVHMAADATSRWRNVSSIAVQRQRHPALLAQTTNKTTTKTPEALVAPKKHLSANHAGAEAVMPVMPPPSQSSSCCCLAAATLPLHVWPGSVIDSMCSEHVLHVR